MFILFVMTGNIQHPPLKYETFEEGLKAIRDGLDLGEIVVKSSDAFGESLCVTITGPGTVYRLMSEEQCSRSGAEQRERAARLTQGLIVGAPADPYEDRPYRVIILHNGNQIDVDLAYASFEQACEATSSSKGVFENRVSETDHFAYATAPGTTFLVLSKEGADQRRRAIVAQQMRMANARTETAGPRIILKSD